MRCCKNCGWLRWVTTTDTSYYCDFVVGEILGNLSECCQEWKSTIQTNADRIRSMTDAELAEWFGMSERMCPDGFSETIDCDACPEVCTGHWLLWLKEEVKE